MDKGKAGEGSHPEGHQAPTEGSFPIVTGGGSNGELKVTAEPKVTVDPPVTNATETLASPGSASTVPMAGAPVRNATEAMASPGSASKAPTAGGQVSSPAGNTASPGSASKVQKSVKHLECAYYFGSKEGCKWTEEQCLYSHTPTGSRATAPVQIEPGRPPVAGKNAQNPHPEYHNWRNSFFEQGVPESTPESAKQGPQFPPRPAFPLPIRRQLDHISAKARLQSQQRPPNQSPTPVTGKLKYNIHATPFTSAYQKYNDPTKPGPMMTSPVGPPGMGPPVHPPVNNQNSGLMAGPANPAANNQNPYYGAHPQHFAPGGYYLAPPPASPGYFDYEGALRNCQYQLEMSQEENARKTAEIDALRNALATKGIELEASASGDLKLRTSLQLAIDAVLILDFYSEAVVLKYREMCNERGIEGTLLVSELSEIAKALPLGRQKTVISQVRDRVLAVNKALIDGLDNGLHHHEELRRLRAWLRNQLAEVGDDSAYDQFIMGRCISGYKWKPFLK